MKLFLYVLVTALYTSFAYGESLPLDMVMTTEQEKQMGLDTLTPEQKSAFEAWLGEWTKKVIDQRSSYHPAKGLQRWIAEWPKHVAPLNRAPAAEVHKERKPLDHHVDRVINNGAIVDLLDGSVWTIPLYERYKTRNWQHGDSIDVEKTDVASPPYRLKNNNRKQVVDAQMQQPPSETGKKEPESAEKFAGTIEVASIGSKGQLVRLADGSTWKIAPPDQKQVMTWKKFDRIHVGKVDNYLYPNTLTNLDNGGNTAQANSTDSR